MAVGFFTLLLLLSEFCRKILEPPWQTQISRNKIRIACILYLVSTSSMTLVFCSSLSALIIFKAIVKLKKCLLIRWPSYTSTWRTEVPPSTELR